MMSKEECIDLYLDRLNDGLYDKDNQPNCGSDLSSEFVDEQLENYDKVLASEDFFNSIIS